MATNTRELQEQFKIFSQRQVPRMGYPCKVIAINDDDTIDVVDDSDIELFGVRLRAAVDNNTNGIVITPAIDSWVLVAPVDGQREELYVTMYSEIDSVKIAKEKKGITINAAEGTIQMNEGSNGGLTITPELVTQLGVLSARVDTLEDAITTPEIVTPQDGGIGYQALMTAIIRDEENIKEDFSKIENTNVKH